MIRLMSYIYKAGETIPLHPNILWRIESGLVQLVTTEAGKRITLDILGRGEIIGEAVLEVSPCSLACLTDVKIEVLPICLWRHLLWSEMVD